MQRNYIVFIALSAVVLAGWYWLAPPMPTQKKKEPDPAKIAKAKDEPVKKIDNKKEDKDEKKEPKAEIKPPTKEVAKEQPKAKTETLGGDGYHLSVDTTSRGAGVRKVVLNAFKTADWRGRPVHPQRPLQLVPDDEFAPAFRMYHFEHPEDQNPVFGLGEKIWDFDGRKGAEGNVQEVRYSTTVPGLDHIKIVKTYRLAPKDYHVTMLLEFEDTRDPNDKTAGKATFLRYQVVGATGLPIEGEWYATTFRNSIIGLVDQRGTLWRKLEDSARI